jgi:hypothetical protein
MCGVRVKSTHHFISQNEYRKPVIQKRCKQNQAIKNTPQQVNLMVRSNSLAMTVNVIIPSQIVINAKQMRRENSREM